MNDSYIDIYCERTGPEYWSEPVNAATNFSFIICALLVGRMIRRRASPGSCDVVPWVLCVLIFVIGVGSWLFHTHATRWALLSDVIPIAIFILTYTWYALRRFVGATAIVCGLGVAAVLGIAMAVPLLTGFRGGAYVAALIAMLLIGGYLQYSRSSLAGTALLLAGAVFFVSLMLRTFDLPLCGHFALGTHFAWHVLNAIVLFIVARAMVMHGRVFDSVG
jgi:hypothetical protein